VLTFVTTARPGKSAVAPATGLLFAANAVTAGKPSRIAAPQGLDMTILESGMPRQANYGLLGSGGAYRS
jgi:hypothetical protein